MALLRAVLFAMALASAESSASLATSREQSLMQTWGKALEDSSANPVTRVVNLLKEMQETLKKEMDEDEELYEKAACWCNNNEYETKEKIAAMLKEIKELEAKIEELTAKSAELNTLIK